MIAIIEDDMPIAQLEQYALSTAGMKGTIYPDGQTFFDSLSHTLPELVILDVMLPDMDGYEILSRIRSQSATSNLPIMMVTSKGTELDIVQGLEEGADDYLPKPFGIMEFLSRVKALLRRTNRGKPSSLPIARPLSFREIVMNEEQHRVTVKGEEVFLSLKEYDLLKLFLSQPETAISRNEIMEQVWGCDFALESRTLDMHLRSLRQKLNSAGNYLHTLRKVGYILTER